MPSAVLKEFQHCQLPSWKSLSILDQCPPALEIEEEKHRLCGSFAALSQWMIELNEEHSLAESRILALDYAVQPRLQAYDEVSNDSILISNHCAVRLQLLSTLEIDHLVHFERFCDDRSEFLDG